MPYGKQRYIAPVYTRMLNWAVPFGVDIAIFAAAAIAIGFAGAKAAGFADRLADRTGLGESITGTVVLGFMTAVPGLMASIVAAWKGYPVLAISNAAGGIAVQTAALAVADIAYRKANLEHAAASVTNMMQTVMLILLLTLGLMAIPSPNVTIGHVHPMTFVLFIAAGSAFWLALRTSEAPMWRPHRTQETVLDVPAPGHEDDRLSKLIAGLAATAVVTGASGAVVAEAAENIMVHTGISQVVVGGLLMAIATSLPEFATSIAAVRRGALTLAVSDIVGGNFFDVLFLAAADLAYIHGSLYHAEGVGPREIFLLGFTIIMNIILLMGLIYRQKQGPGNIGFESVLMLATYVTGFTILSLAY